MKILLHHIIGVIMVLIAITLGVIFVINSPALVSWGCRNANCTFPLEGIL